MGITYAYFTSKVSGNTGEKSIVVNDINEIVVDSFVRPIENQYKVNIGKKKTSEIDYTKFIENLIPDKQDLEIEVITDLSTNPDQVVVRISDGDSVDFIKIAVESTGNPSAVGDFDLWFLIILGVILAGLIMLVASTGVFSVIGL